MKDMDHNKLREMARLPIPQGGKERLSNHLEKDIRTLFIGIIDEIEKSLGYLWGHGNEELTDNQKRFLERWQFLRKRILDRGNNTIRKMDQTINKINLERYHYNMKVRSGNLYE